MKKLIFLSLLCIMLFTGCKINEKSLTCETNDYVNDTFVSYDYIYNNTGDEIKKIIITNEIMLKDFNETEKQDKINIYKNLCDDIEENIECKINESKESIKVITTIDYRKVKNTNITANSMILNKYDLIKEYFEERDFKCK